MKPKKYPSQKALKELFDYKDGQLIWKEHHGYNAKKGQPAGYVNVRGYRIINLKCELFLSHRLVWIWHNGCINDVLDIDHINRVKNDNRIENLRTATRSENLRNNNGASVSFHKKANKWRAYVWDGKHQKHLGLFITKQEALTKASIAANN